MTCRIEAGVLAFAVGKVLELPNDPGSMKPGPRQVHVDRLDPDHHRMPAPGRSARRVAFRNHDRAAAELKLRAVGADLHRTSKANASVSHFTAAGTPGYSRTGMIAAAGMERFVRIRTASNSVDLRATARARFGLSWRGRLRRREASSRRVGEAWISLDSLVRIEPFQRLTREVRRNCFRRRPPSARLVRRQRRRDCRRCG
jgi:hypothetical protein